MKIFLDQNITFKGSLIKKGMTIPFLTESKLQEAVKLFDLKGYKYRIIRDEEKTTNNTETAINIETTKSQKNKKT